MPTDFEIRVDDEMPNRIASQEASQTASYFPRYTGTAKLTTERSPAQVASDLAVVLRNGTTPLTGDWDNTGRRIRNTGVMEIVAGDPGTLVAGLVWWDTEATGSPGASIRSVTTITADLTLTTSHAEVMADASAGPIVAKLPPVAASGGRIYLLKKIDSSANLVTLDGDGALIDDEATRPLVSKDAAIAVISDITQWRIRMVYLPNQDFILEVAKGNVAGHRIMRGLGERDNIGTTAAGEDLWRGNELSGTPQAPGSHTSIPFPADAGERMTLVSESNADNGATATGALTVVVSYLDGSGNEQSETVTMNGTTQVDTAAEDIRFVQDIQVKTVGSNGACEGHIRIFRLADETRVYSMIAAGGNQSLVPHKMVPLGKTLYLKRWGPSEKSAQKRCLIRLRADCDNAMPPVRQQGVFLFKSVMALDGAATMMDLAYAIPALSIVKASAWANVSNAEVAIHWWGVLVDD